MKTSGLPCRATLDCEAVFTVARSDSMESLKEAGSLRDSHEVQVHGYRHVIRDVAAATPFSQAGSVRRGRPKRSEELSPV